jgi:N-acetylneuraminate synthase
VAVLGAVALGACVIEKHFTDDETRKGPDHSFAMNPSWWEFMVRKTRELEAAMGDGFKLTERNEEESRIVQRRAIRLKRDLVKDSIITAADIEFLRPCPEGAFTPAQVLEVVGATLRRDRNSGDHITHTDING